MKKKKELRTLLKEMAAKHGFRPALTDLTHPEDRPSHEARDVDMIVEEVTADIKRSQAFLQLNPRTLLHQSAAEEDLQWMIYEAGLARGHGLPSIICVDATSQSHILEWKKAFAVLEGMHLSRFNGQKSARKICQDIEVALDTLARRVTG